MKFVRMAVQKAKRPHNSTLRESSCEEKGKSTCFSPGRPQSCFIGPCQPQVKVIASKKVLCCNYLYIYIYMYKSIRLSNMHVNTCTALAANSVFHPQRTWVVRMDQQIVLSADLLHMLHRPQSRWRKKKNTVDGTAWP